TSRKTVNSPASYDRISSICDGFTERRPRTTFTNTGKKQSTAAMTILDVFVSGSNHAFVIGAKAMIGIAFAAIAYGRNAVPSSFQRATITAKTAPAVQPIAKPPSASWKVNQPSCQSWPWLSLNDVQIVLGAGRRNRWMSSPLTTPSQIAI